MNTIPSIVWATARVEKMTRTLRLSPDKAYSLCWGTYVNIWKRLRGITCSPSDEENLGQQRAQNEVGEFNNKDLAATERLQLVIRRIRVQYSHTYPMWSMKSTRNVVIGTHFCCVWWVIQCYRRQVSSGKMRTIAKKMHLEKPRWYISWVYNGSDPK